MPIVGRKRGKKPRIGAPLPQKQGVFASLKLKDSWALFLGPREKKALVNRLAKKSKTATNKNRTIKLRQAPLVKPDKKPERKTA